jgi:septal ring factor EnvC (AmiA/AmiB activator)
MRSAILACLIVLPLAAASSAPAGLDSELQRARQDEQSAEAEAARLGRLAKSARDAAARLRAQRLAAAQAIGAAEAGISVADGELRLVKARQQALLADLRRRQQPTAGLLAGLAMMARRPPILVLAGNGSSDELVRVRVLLDSTIPVIRARTASLSRQLAAGTALQQSAIAARDKLQRSRSQLDRRRQEFALLEQRALQDAAASSGQALDAGDTAIASGETVETLASAAANARALSVMVASLQRMEPPPPRPVSVGNQSAPPPLRYMLPVEGPVTAGLGAVSASGVRSRGLAMATPRGRPVSAPGAGEIRFAGPFRDYDGIVIIDHGGGWMSLLVNVGTSLTVGQRVALGESLGRTLGPVEIELSRQGRRVSPAIIAGSSGTLSKGGKPS